MICQHCHRRKVGNCARGLCVTCWRVLRAEGRLDALYPPKRWPRGTSPLEWHGRHYEHR